MSSCVRPNAPSLEEPVNRVVAGGDLVPGALSGRQAGSEGTRLERIGSNDTIGIGSPNIECDRTITLSGCKNSVLDPRTTSGRGGDD